MTIENRLIQIREYLKEAELDPENNKLYIEDLKLSIAHFEQVAFRASEFEIKQGFVLDN